MNRAGKEAIKPVLKLNRKHINTFERVLRLVANPNCGSLSKQKMIE